MYRRYEDPRKLEKRLAELKRQYSQTEDLNEQIVLAENIAELKERINFAWQDEYQEEEF